MRRIDRIHVMGAAELAGILMENGMDNYIEFCRNDKECSELDDIPDEMCRECLTRWLMEEEG